MSVRAVIAEQLSHLFGSESAGADLTDIADELEIDADDGEWADGTDVAVESLLDGGVNADDADDVESAAASAATSRVNSDDERSEDERPDEALGAEELRQRRNRREDRAMVRAVRGALPKNDGSVVVRPKKRKRKVNYGINAVLDVPSARIYGDDEWLFDRDAANMVVDEDARTHQLILQRTIENSRSEPPPRGMRKRVTPPKAIADARFPKWNLRTTPKLYTTNVVSTFYLGAPVHLVNLVNRIPGTCLNPRCFAAGKLCSKTVTTLIFPGGSAVCAGANSAALSRMGCIECTTMLQRVGIQAEVSEFRIENVVSSADAGFPIDLFDLAANYPTNAHFTPDCFPGLMFRLTLSQLVFIIFKSGKCIITGVPTREASLLAWRWFHSNVLWEFEMEASSAHSSEADYRRERRQQASLAQEMCNSVRDITVMHLAMQAAVKKEPIDGEAALGNNGVFDALCDLTVNPQGSLANPIDLEQWLEGKLQLDRFPAPPMITQTIKPEPNDDDDECRQPEPDDFEYDSMVPARIRQILEQGGNISIEFDCRDGITTHMRSTVQKPDTERVIPRRIFVAHPALFRNLDSLYFAAHRTNGEFRVFDEHTVVNNEFVTMTLRQVIICSID